MFSLVPERLFASQAATHKQRLEAKLEQEDDECLEAAERRWRVAKAANNTAAADAVLKAWRASKDVVAAKLAKPEEKKRLRRQSNQRIKEAIAARCQCPSTCVLVGAQFSLRRRIMVPSYRRLCRGSSASSR